MRYGKPSLGSAIEKLRARGVRELTVVPLYPQYASSSTGSSLERVYRLVGEAWNVEALRVLPPFYDRPAFLDAFADVGRPVLAGGAAGPRALQLPRAARAAGEEERPHRGALPRAGGLLRHAGAGEPLVLPDAVLPHRARAGAAARARGPATWTVTFQSRLGRTPWIKPYTDLVLPELAREGREAAGGVLPGVRGGLPGDAGGDRHPRAQDQFLAAGGEALTLVPSLNAHPSWVRGLTQMLRELRRGRDRRALSPSRGNVAAAQRARSIAWQRREQLLELRRERARAVRPLSTAVS